jgi:hypothetical protein
LGPGFDLLGQLDLLQFGEQAAAADLLQVRAEGVVGFRRRLGRGGRLILALQLGQEVGELGLAGSRRSGASAGAAGSSWLSSSARRSASSGSPEAAAAAPRRGRSSWSASSK